MDTLARSLRLKVTLGVVLPLVMILGAITAVEYSRYRISVLDNASVLASHSGQVVEASLRHAMLETDFDEVQRVLDALGEMDEFQVVYLLDTSGLVIFAPNGDGVGTHLDSQGSECQPCHRLSASERPASVLVTIPGGVRVYRSMYPIENGPECARCHGSGDRLLGLLLTDLSTAPLERALRADFYEHLAWWAVVVLVTITVVNWVLSQFVLGRLERLSVAMRRFGLGERSALLSDRRPDEIGHLASAFNTMAQQVQARTEENRQLSESLSNQSAVRGELLKRLITAQEDERQRVARELHDGLGQALSGLSLRVEALQRLIASERSEVREQLPTIRALITETTERMYELILDLRPSALDDLGLEVAIVSYAERLFDKSGIVFHLDSTMLNRRLPPAVEIALYRVSQEALTNIVRHAQAKRVEITLVERNGVLEASITDNGCGFDLAVVNKKGHSPRGLGLLGIHERIMQCGGQVEIVSHPGKGTQIHLHVPLGEEDNL